MVVATANGAGYRYGVSDQAFYIPVVVRALDPGAFPRDAALIDAQGQLMLSDEALAGVVRGDGLEPRLGVPRRVPAGRRSSSGAA